MYEDIWKKLYCEARKVQKERVISPFIEAGGVAAALLTKKGSIYLLSVGAIISSLYLTAKVLKASVYSNDNLSYVYRNLIDDTVPVVSTDDGKVIKPFGGEEVSVVKGFYEKDAESKAQEQSIIYYQNTYMPNTGVLYGAKEEFEVLVVADGTVEDVVADEVLGNVVTIKHTNNLITRYESLNEVNVMVGDTLKKGDVIGTSGENKIDSTYSNMLLFEVEHNGTYANLT